MAEERYGGSYVPVRTSLGTMALTFGNDLIAKAFSISLNAMTWGGRIALLILPPLAYVLAYRICLGLQRHDRGGARARGRDRDHQTSTEWGVHRNPPATGAG